MSARAEPWIWKLVEITPFSLLWELCNENFTDPVISVAIRRVLSYSSQIAKAWNCLDILRDISS